MYEDDDSQPERLPDPATRAKEKSDEFRMHAELAAVFEGTRKFDAEIIPGLDPDFAREIQRGMAKLERAKAPDSPILPPEQGDDAAKLLNYFKTHKLSTNNYHVARRPGEVMIVRWLDGEEVNLYYERLQAHFDAAMTGFREDETRELAWKQDEPTLAYLKALEEADVKMAEHYLREPIKELKLYVLSNQTADEINIAYLTETIMNVAPADLIGRQSAPPEDSPSESELAWFFKLFSLRGVHDGVEQMCYFAFLQKSDESFDEELSRTLDPFPQ